ncbi:MAG: hypothetical protein ABFS38_18580, partial [Bacteroidota bacterium]
MKRNLLITGMAIFMSVSLMSQVNLLENGDFEEQGSWSIIDRRDNLDQFTVDFGSPEAAPKYGDGKCL